MALQFILGPSGAGKSEYIYEDIIRRTMQDERENVVVLVPEQYSLEIQRKLVQKHPRGGSFQIDVIGFNRLAYRIFDELHIKPKKVLEDFGKSMLLRKAAQEHKEELSLYAGSLDKAGFIDEAKSLMSEIYQYDGSAGGGTAAGNRAVGQSDLGLNGGIAAGVQDLAADHRFNFQIVHHSNLPIFDEIYIDSQN